jgi:hypothetical protein
VIVTLLAPGKRELLGTLRLTVETALDPGTRVPVARVVPPKATDTVPVGAIEDPDTVMVYGVGWLK